MRLNFKIIFLVCLLHVICSGQTYFQKFYKIAYSDLFSSHVFQQSDSSLNVFNYTQDSLTGRQDLCVYKITPSGVLTSKKIHSYLNSDFLSYSNGFKQFYNNNNYSSFAVATTYTASKNTIVLSKINNFTLDTIRNNYFDDGIYDYYVNNFIKLRSNKYFLIGSKGNNTIFSPVLFEVDSNLNIVSSFSVMNQMSLFNTNAVLNPITKKIILAGTITYGANQVNVGLVEIDTTGVVTNSMILSQPGIQGITQLKYSNFDNSYVFNGSLRTSKYGNSNLYRLQLTKINSSNLNVVWQKTYGSASILNNLMSLIVNQDGSIITCGRYSDSTSLPLMNYDANGIILKTNSNGDSLWMRQYNNYAYGTSSQSFQEALFGVERTLDGGYILCGNVLNQPAAKAWVVKTDSLGCVSPGCGSIITSGYRDVVASASSFEVYPNPAANQLTIKSASPSEPLRILIHDLEGRVLYDERLETSNNLSNLDIDLVNGVYLITIQNSNHETVTKKLVINN